MPDELYLMTPTEIHRGFVVGFEGRLPHVDTPSPSPRAALEEAVRPALERPPCGIAFSGGRDSSLVLAIATHVARREGLADPVPITRRFPGVDEADESEWQELVVRHLGLTEWQRIDLTDELDIVGPIAARHLTEHGVLWPPSIAGVVHLVDQVPGGSLLDGEGGDEVLGDEAHRISPVARLLRDLRHVNRWRVRHALGALAPAPVRVPRIRRRREVSARPWLRPAAWGAFMDAIDEIDAAEPLAFSSSVRLVPRRRTQVLADRNRRILAARRGVIVVSPLLDPTFVRALAHHGGRLGPGDRTAVLRWLADDLLPDDVLSRTPKATFTTAYLGAPTRAFARDWDGSGLDPELVDPEVLRSLWLSECPPAPTSSMLQAAWIASRKS